MFKNLDENRTILIKGNPGIGKTTLSRKIVYDWANDKWDQDSELKSILLFFLVTLKYIDRNQTIEEMIKKQHECLVLNGEISAQILKEILEKCGKQCLVILEGYDEIPENFNKNLQEAIENKAYRDCHFILTSRPNAVESLEGYMSSIASIEGFSKANTRKYIEKVIEDETKWEAAFRYTENSAIEEMWRYPILVLFLCLLVNWGAVDLDKENLLVGEFYTRLLNCIFRRFIAEKIGKDKQEEEEAKQEETLLKIGKLAFKGLLTNKVAYKKRDILKTVGPNAFKYGILIGTDEWEGRRDMPENADIFVHFVHKSIQEYLAAHQMYLGKTIGSLIGKQRRDLGLFRSGGEQRNFESHDNERANLEFLQKNLMFFTFCSHFTNKSNIHDSDVGSDSDGDVYMASENVTDEEVREQLVDFVASCLDVKELKLEGVAIYEESSWLFLEALPKCSQIQRLMLKNMKLHVSVPLLLQGISKSLEYLHNDSCVLENTMDTQNTSISFSKLKTIKLSGDGNGIHVLMSSAWNMLKTLDLDEYKLTVEHVKVIDEANRKGYLPNMEQIIGQGQICNLGELKTLIAHPWLKLEVLNLDQSNVNAHDIEAIGKANEKRSLPCMKSISLIGNHNISNSISTLLRTSWLELEKLYLDKCNLTIQAVEAIGMANKKGSLPCMGHISLNWNDHISGSISALLQSAWLRLGVLNLYACDFGTNDVSAIASAHEKGILPSIDLSVYFLSSGHIPVAPVMCGAWGSKSLLDLTDCLFSDQDVITIAEANKHGMLSSVKEIIGLERVLNTEHLPTLFSYPWKSLETIDTRKYFKQDLLTIADANRDGFLPSVENLQVAENTSIGCRLYTLLNNKWPSLKTLNIEGCNLTRDDLSAIHEANEKGFLPNIDLKVRSLSSRHIPIIPIMCGAWKFQNVLDMRNCNLSNQDVMAIGEANKHGLLKSVKEIIGLERVSKHFHTLFSHPWRSLEILDLRMCDEQNVITIAKANRLGRLLYVKKMNLSGNKNVSGQVGVLLSSPWQVLEKLDLEQCDLIEEDISAIAEAHEKNFLSGIDLSVKSSAHIPVVQVMCGAWREHKVINMSLEDRQDVITISEANKCGQLPSVREIDLRNNKFISGHVSILVSHPWTQMEKLSLDGCDLNAEDIEAIGIANKKRSLSCIKHVSLNFNTNISGSLPKLLCNAWPTLITLNVLECKLMKEDISAIREAIQKGLLPNIDPTIKLSSSGLISVVHVMNGAWRDHEILYLEEFDNQDMAVIAEAKKYGLLPSAREIIGMERVYDNEQLASVLFSHQWRSLETLDLRGCDRRDVITIAEANSYGLLPSVKKIHVDEHITGHISTLVSHPWLQLVRFNLDDCVLSSQDVKAILKANEKGFLPSIDLSVDRPW